MGRRKIEIKAIKDDRNRSVTFLKRKGGLFKKAHELSVLCSVDVAVFVFGNNKKLYEYSSTDMRDLITRHQYHGGANEHKGPSDFNGGNDDDDDEEGDGTPPHGIEHSDNQMMPPHFHGQPTPAPFPQIRHHTPSASPPIGNDVPFQGHPGHHQRSVTPQGHMGSRPGSRNDMRRLGPNMVSHNVGPHGPHPGITYMPTPPIYNPPATQATGAMPPQGTPYQYASQPSSQPQTYMEERRPSAPPGYAPPPPGQTAQRMEASPHPPLSQQLPPQSIPHISPPPQPDRRFNEPPPPPPVEFKTELADRPHAPLLNTDSAIKKLPQRKGHSIFTPIDDNRSILSQHLDSFMSEPQAMKSESAAAAAAANRSNTGEASRNGAMASPRPPQRSVNSAMLEQDRKASISSHTDAAPTPPSRSNSLKTGGPGGGSRPRGPRLTVQIPDGGSEPGSATGESNSPRIPADGQPPTIQRQNSHSSGRVLPPPSPSGPTLLSAGATGPPNPFARPPPQQINETPATALPSRFLSSDYLPSPSAFYSDWSMRNESNTLPSPLNFATPVTGTVPNFMKEDHHSGSQPNASASGGTTLSAAAPSTTIMSDPDKDASQSMVSGKRKSPEQDGLGQSEGQGEAGDPKRVKMEASAE